MRILLSTHLYPAPDDKSMVSDADALREFVADWKRQGHEVTVLHAYLEKEQGLMKAMEFFPRIRYSEGTVDGVPVYRARIRCVKSNARVRRDMMKRAAERFQEEIKPPYDLYLAHFPVICAGLVETIRSGADPVGVLHTVDIQRLTHDLTEMPRGLSGLGFRSERIKRDFERLMPFKGYTFVAPSGCPEAAAHQAPYRQGELKILYAGKLIKRKQPDMLLRSCRALPRDVPWRLTIAGAGEMAGDLHRMVEEWGLADRVSLPGPLSHADALRAMAESDVFSLPSYGETFGISYLEAMSRGAVAVGSVGEGIDGVIVDGENGFLLDARDEKGLTALLTRLWNMDGAEWSRIVENAYSTARRMSGGAMARAYLENAVKAGEEREL